MRLAQYIGFKLSGLSLGNRLLRWIPIVIVALFSSSLLCGYVTLDDDKLIRDNMPFLRNLANIPHIFTSHYFEREALYGFYYRPLVTLSYMCDAWLGRGEPWLLHLTNILLHAISSCLVFLLLKTVLYKPSTESMPGTEPHTCPSRVVWTAFFATLLFAVHPVQAMAVVWIPGRNDLLFACFALTSFLGFVRTLRGETIAGHLVHFAFFFFALLTKEVAVCLPVLCILYRLLVEPPTSLPPPESALIRSWEKWMNWALRVIATLPFFGWLGIGFVWMVLRGLALGIAGFSGGMSLQVSNLPLIFAMLLKYLGKVMVPINPSLLPSFSGTPLWAGMASLALMATFMLYARRAGAGIRLFGLLWFIGFLVIATPFSEPSDIENLSLLEHRLYVPFIGLLLFWASPWLDFGTLHQSPASSSPFIKAVSRTLMIALTVCAIGFTSYTSSRIPDFRDSLAFWTAATKQSPQSDLAALNLGVICFQSDRLEDGRLLLEKSLRLNPTKRLGNLNLALYYISKKDYARGEFLLKKEISLYPEFTYAYELLADLLDDIGRHGEAITCRTKLSEIKSEIKTNLEQLPSNRMPFKSK
jgi:hypothetical protein